MASSRGDSSGNIKPSPNPSPKQPGLLVVWAGLVLKDLLHFNASGYRLQGNMLVSALMGVYNAKAEFPMETRSLSHYLDSMYSRLTP